LVSNAISSLARIFNKGIFMLSSKRVYISILFVITLNLARIKYNSRRASGMNKSKTGPRDMVAETQRLLKYIGSLFSLDKSVRKNA
jgi:hypothetical protein